jgi:putative PEP-CTERM system histidine kinase
VLQVAFFFGSGFFLFLLLFSGQIRTRLRLLLSEHFFSFKYDYREEWLRFTETLSSGGDNIAEAVIRGLSEIVGSPGGALWVKREGQFFQLDTCVGIVEPQLSMLPEDETLVLFLERTDSLIDLSDYSMHPESYEGFEVPGWLDDWDKAWMIIPLLFHGELNAFVVLARPGVKRPVNWEDRDLLLTAGKQAASHIAQHEANKALMQARQFEAFSKISAYVAHDLKNLLAQQTLVVANAEKHKGNPAFIEDVVRTLRSSVDRMNRLMEQLRNGVRGEQRDLVLLDEVLGEVMEIRSKQKPQPVFEKIDEGLTVMAQKDRLATVFGHLIQNAQEATEADGIVTVRLFRNGGRAVVEIEDKGSGMSQDFIRDRLFRPFDSTKGLTGMGIGAFESREFVRALGGDLLVKSVLGEGSSFRILLPCAGAANEGVPSIPAGQEAVK